MAKRLSLVVLVAAMAVFLVTPASGQETSPYMWMVDAGYAKWLEDGAPDGSFGVGGGMAYMFRSMPMMTVGAEVHYLALGSEDVGDVEVTWAVIPVTGQVMYFMEMESRAMPFLTGGAGLYHLRTDVDCEDDCMGLFVEDTETDNKGGINLGGGLKIETDGRMSFGADARIHIVFTEDETTNILTVMGKVFF